MAALLLWSSRLSAHALPPHQIPLQTGNKPAAFPFFYINPKDHKELVRRYLDPLLGSITDEEIEAMDPIGNSPNFISKSDLRKLAPLWANFTVRMKTDPDCDKAWGWVLEMYAYTVAAKGVGVSHDLFPKLAAQPPWDTKLTGFYILHYTYGNDYTMDGVFTPGKIGAWRFDKRSYMGSAPPKNLTLPPKARAPRPADAPGALRTGVGALILSCFPPASFCLQPLMLFAHYRPHSLAARLSKLQLPLGRRDRSPDGSLPLPPPLRSPSVFPPPILRQGVPETVVTLIEMINEASANIPNWCGSNMLVRLLIRGKQFGVWCVW